MITSGMGSQQPKHTDTPSAAVINQAAEWLVRLSADELTPADHTTLIAEFEQWQQVHPHHAKAAQAMTGLMQQTKQASKTACPTAAHAAIEASLTHSDKQGHVRNLAKSLLLVLALSLPVWLLLQHMPPAYLLADVRTTTGEWALHTLADNSIFTLGNKSAANFHLDHQQRQLELVHGEVLVNVAADPDRPFLVLTRHGRIRALGTRFIVSLNDQTTTLTMLESRATVSIAAAAIDQTSRDANEVIVDAGQRVHFTAQWISNVETVDTFEIADAWESRHLIVKNRPLPEVLDELSRHRTGLFHYDREALEAMKVTAALPLDNVDKALYLLSRSFPIQVHHVTSWLTIIESSHSNDAQNSPDRVSVLE